MVRSLYVDGIAQHKNPVPNAAVHRGFLHTSSILGKQPDADSYPPDIETQARLCFDSLVGILSAAGATLQDVVSVDIFMADKAERDVVNRFWLACWPDAQHRPARNAQLADLPDGCRLQLAALAILPPEEAEN